mmetsp:Transcript_9372/g.21822  ORF Transcript_9372/g.21822 Transcript_9372/m.21822 type:complete len:297 (+) Transcript_9372:213-1103(+)
MVHRWLGWRRPGWTHQLGNSFLAVTPKDPVVLFLRYTLFPPMKSFAPSVDRTLNVSSLPLHIESLHLQPHRLEAQPAANDEAAEAHDECNEARDGPGDDARGLGHVHPAAVPVRRYDGGVHVVVEGPVGGHGSLDKLAELPLVAAGALAAGVLLFLAHGELALTAVGAEGVRTCPVRLVGAVARGPVLAVDTGELLRRDARAALGLDHVVHREAVADVFSLLDGVGDALAVVLADRAVVALGVAVHLVDGPGLCDLTDLRGAAAAKFHQCSFGRGCGALPRHADLLLRRPQPTLQS